MQYASGRKSVRFSQLTILMATLILAGCAVNPVQVADSHIAQDEWTKAVLTYRKATADEPLNVEYKSRLKQVELKAADFYYQRGLARFEQGDFDGAIVLYQQGLAAMPEHVKLLQATRQVLLRKEANNLYAEALRAKEAGQPEEMRRLLRRALDSYPEFKSAEELLAHEASKLAESESGDRLKVSSRAPITLNFRQTDIRTAFEFIAKSFSIDVVFDDGVRTMPVTLFAKDVTFEEALSLILTTTKTFYKKVGVNTILIAPESKEKRGQYEDQMVRVFQLTNIHAKEMADILKGIAPLKKIIINDDLNTIIVRDTEEAIKVAEKIISVNDRRPAELVLEVEILEVNRSKAERLGLDMSPYSVKASIPSTAVISLAGNVRNAVRNASVLTLPPVTFNYYKQDVDAKTLANPRLRVLSGKNAKIHIGDRVPLRAATIQDATGQVRTTYDYKEIGIRLTTEPIVHLDNSVTVKVGLEVSSLGQNIGSQTEPAYSIGTRNAETFMLLRDGETAILGGLIRDEDRKTRLSIPMIGDIPAIGTLLSSKDDTNGRTDVLLTITPRVVRGWDLPAKEEQMFVSGSEDRFSSQALFGGFTASRVAPVATGSSTSSLKDVRGASPKVDAEPDPAIANPAIKGGTDNVSSNEMGVPALLAFSESIYEGVSGKELEINLVGSNLEGASEMKTEIVFNPQLVKYTGNKAGTVTTKDFKVDVDAARGLLRLNWAFPNNTPMTGNAVLASIKLKGEKPGTSYIVYRDPALIKFNGTKETVQVRASRVVFK